MQAAPIRVRVRVRVKVRPYPECRRLTTSKNSKRAELICIEPRWT